MPAPPPDTSSLLVSASLFVVVVLASQVIQNRRRDDEEEREQHHVDFDLGHCYSMKRPYPSRENLNELSVELNEKEEASLESVSAQQSFYAFCFLKLMSLIYIIIVL